MLQGSCNRRLGYRSRQDLKPENAEVAVKGEDSINAKTKHNGGTERVVKTNCVFSVFSQKALGSLLVFRQKIKDLNR
jgi:hypothetical protein